MEVLSTCMNLTDQFVEARNDERGEDGVAVAISAR